MAHVKHREAGITAPQVTEGRISAEWRPVSAAYARWFIRAECRQRLRETGRIVGRLFLLPFAIMGLSNGLKYLHLGLDIQLVLASLILSSRLDLGSYVERPRKGSLPWLSNLRDDPSPLIQHPVFIQIAKGGRILSGDHGLISFAGSWLVYAGVGTSFSLRRSAIAYDQGWSSDDVTGFDLKISDGVGEFVLRIHSSSASERISFVEELRTFLARPESGTGEGVFPSMAPPRYQRLVLTWDSLNLILGKGVDLLLLALSAILSYLCFLTDRPTWVIAATAVLTIGGSIDYVRGISRRKNAGPECPRAPSRMPFKKLLKRNG